MQNISAIKKLPEKEKIKIINKIWDSIDETPPNFFADKEINLLLKERLKEIKLKTVKTDSWENVKKRLINKADVRLKNVVKNV